MNFKRIFTIVFLIYSFPVFTSAQNRDSLQQILFGKVSDTVRAKIHNELSYSYLRENDYLAIKEAKMALEYAQKSNHIYYETRAYINLGSAYDNTIRYSDAQKFYFKALKLAEEEKDIDLLLEIYNKIGIIYSYQKNSKQALKYFTKFLETAEKSGKEDFLARGYNNLGISLKNEGKLEEAIDYYHKALVIFKKRDYKRGIVSCNSNIGVGWMELGQMDSAARYYRLAEEQAFSMKDTFSMAITLINIGELMQKQQKTAQSVQYYLNAIQLSQKKEMLQQLRDAHEGLYKCYERSGDFKNAFIHHRQYLKLRDSIFNDETNGKLALAEQNYMQLLEDQQREKEEQRNKIEKAEKDKLIAQEKAKNEENKKYVWILVLISLAVFVIAIVLYFRYQEKRKSNTILSHQRDEIAQSKKEITDSINYALRIQQAVLPDVNELKNYFRDYFVFFRPKDIVSGDFYWFAKRDNYFYLAVADCTGHGVPGGFMSMIGTDKLNHVIFERRQTETGKILAQLSRGVKTALKQDESADATRDGMDISLLSILVDPHETNPSFQKLKEIQWSGANRSLWKISNGNLIDYKPTKSAIGGFTSENTLFETHAVSFATNDTFYLFSDGFADQFGGKDQKKLSTKRFREKLISIQHLSMLQQKSELIRMFDEWKGSGEQIDDVLVIGIRV